MSNDLRNLPMNPVLRPYSHKTYRRTPGTLTGFHRPDGGLRWTYGNAETETSPAWA